MENEADVIATVKVECAFAIQGEGLSAKPDCSASGRIEAAKNIEQGRLTAAGWSQ